MDHNVGEEDLNISHLPDELMYAVFRLFDALELLPLSRVCKRWMWLIDDPRLRKVVNFSSSYYSMVEPPLLLSEIISNAPLLHTFDVANLHGSVNHVMPILAENCPHLSVLKLARCLEISTNTWQLIGADPWPRLTHLCLQECRVNDDTLVTILPTVSKVTVLGISHNRDITNKSIQCLTGCTPNLRCILLYALRYVTCEPTLHLLEAVGSNLTQLSLSRPDRALLTALPTVCTCLRVLALHIECSPIREVSWCLRRLPRLTRLRLSGANGSIGIHTLHKLFRDVDEFLDLELLEMDITGPVDDHVIGDIARVCGNRLRWLSILGSTAIITSVGLTGVASRCTTLEHLELDSIFPSLVEAVSTMHHLRVLAIKEAADPLDAFLDLRPQITTLKDQLAAILPNTLFCSMDDLYHKAQYKRWRLPNISCTALQ